MTIRIYMKKECVRRSIKRKQNYSEHNDKKRYIMRKNKKMTIQVTSNCVVTGGLASTLISHSQQFTIGPMVGNKFLHVILQ